MASIGNVFQVVTRCSYLSKVLNNTFHFVVTGVGTAIPASQQLAESVENLWSTYVSPVLIAGCVLNQIYAINLVLPIDAHTLTTSVAGGISNSGGEGLPSINAYSFRYTRLGGGQRYGYKRFGGLSENVIDGNTAITNTAALTTLANELVTPLVDSGATGWEFSPYIAKRPTPLGANPLGYIPVAAIFQGVTSQVSRK